MNKTILIADEVAQLLRVDRQRVYELVRKNAIPFILLGERQYRFDEEEILLWIKRGGNQESEVQ
ncbi:MAG TPA: helix-turn-helix domain-containing protein [Pyrinomonadaceae bacterium]|jgi:excisionase family DNA binding protein